MAFQLLLSLVIILLIILIALLFIWVYYYQFKLIHHQFGPVLYLYRYHIGLLSNINLSIELLEKELIPKRDVISEYLKIDNGSTILDTIAAIYYDNQSIQKSVKLRTAVGYIIPIKSTDINETELIQLLKIHNLRGRILPQTKYIVTFFPFILGPLSYIIGAFKIFNNISQKIKLKCHSMEIYNNSKLFDSSLNKPMITYLFPQNNPSYFALDKDMCRSQDIKLYANKDRYAVNPSIWNYIPK